MGNIVSSNTATIVTEDDGTYIDITPSQQLAHEMALAYEAQNYGQDDLSHDTLMGLQELDQELDTQLALFEDTTDSRKYSSTPEPHSNVPLANPGEMGNNSSEQFIEAFNLSRSHGDAHVSPPLITVDDSQVDRDSPIKIEARLKNGTLRIKSEHGSNSIASSIATDRFDLESSLASTPSKGTTPTDLENSFKDTIRVSNGRSSGHEQRPTHHVRPKVSIPTDIAPLEYATQCIAAAESSRLNPYSLHPEEHSMLRSHLSHSQVTTYLNIRNGILRLWTRNPLICVLQDEALGCCKDARWFDVAAICYEWLARNGYINFGCLENVEKRYPRPKPRGPKRKRKTVAVIGAGMSGLGCARQLEGLFAQFEHRFRENGEEIPKVVLLEGRDRVGGRVYSRGLQSKPPMINMRLGSRRTAEMGGMIITGFDRGNPLNILVRGQLALPYHALRPETTIYDSNGQPVDQRRDQLAEGLYNDVLERVSDYKFKVALPPNVDGDKDLLDTGRDAHSDNTRTMKEIEDAAMSSGQPSSSLLNASKLEVVPVSSDRLTGRPHVERGIPAIYTAAFKARKMGWSLKDGVDDSLDIDLTEAVGPKKATLGSVMDDAINQYRNLVHILPLDLRLVNWHIANLEYSNAINVRELSLGGWDVDAGNEWEGKHTMVVGGYQQVPRGLSQCPSPLNVRKKSVVKRIQYSDGSSERPSKIHCEDGNVIEADYIVSSIPLGVLKQNEIEFEPALPTWKTGAIERLGFGILNKVILVYNKPFWDQSRDIFGVLRNPALNASLNQKDYAHNRGRFFQWFNVTKTSGLPTLLALMAGDAAFQVDNSDTQSLVAEATTVLRGVFGPTVPEPVEVVVTRWGQDKFARGSYSYAGPDFQVDDYEVMAKPIGNLFFAGEHTCGTHPATVHGAYLSGLRAASEVLESLIGPITHPNPLLPPKDTPASLKRKATALAKQIPKDPKQSRLEAYEIEVWNAIYTELGNPPWRPTKISANPYILYGKDNFDNARKKCEEGRRPGKLKPAPNEVRIMLAKMWKEATEEEKRPYNERAGSQKQTYAAAMADFKEKAIKWDCDALAFRKAYETQHPSVPGRDENLDDEWTRSRKAKKSAVYAEDSASDADL